MHVHVDKTRTDDRAGAVVSYLADINTPRAGDDVDDAGVFDDNRMVGEDAIGKDHIRAGEELSSRCATLAGVRRHLDPHRVEARVDHEHFGRHAATRGPKQEHRCVGDFVRFDRATQGRPVAIRLQDA